MAIDVFKTVEIIEVMENFLYNKRPDEAIRHQVDLIYKIENQSVIISELRPSWSKPGEVIERGIAKATYFKNKNNWKVFWSRADGQWHGYTPKLIVEDLKEFVALVEEDKHYCFWG